jgi:hypothetical protein
LTEHEQGLCSEDFMEKINDIAVKAAISA